MTERIVGGCVAHWRETVSRVLVQQVCDLLWERLQSAGVVGMSWDALNSREGGYGDSIQFLFDDLNCFRRQH
jgi:hypothetical protein